MINKLTQEQLEKLPLYVKKWTAIGLSTEPFTPDEAEKIVWSYQSDILDQDKTPVLIFSNPNGAWNWIRDQLGLSWSKVGFQAASKVFSKVQSNIEGPLWREIVTQIDTPVINQVESEIVDPVHQQIWYPVAKPLEKLLEEQIKEFVWPFQDGSFHAGHFGFYDFFIQEGLVEINKELKAKFDIWAKTSKLGLIYPLRDFCIVTQKPTKIETSLDGLKVQFKGYPN